MAGVNGSKGRVQTAQTNFTNASHPAKEYAKLFILTTSNNLRFTVPIDINIKQYRSTTDFTIFDIFLRLYRAIDDQFETFPAVGALNSD